jgi:SAM-dependent methyltransferase
MADVQLFTGTKADELRERVKERYGEAARSVVTGQGGCCSSDCCGGTSDASAITSDLYSEVEASQVPLEAYLASLGCGNPTALARLNPGEKVLDLGSGGGIDVLLSARRVGPTGYAYGLDMTDEMLALAEENKRKAGAENVEFLKGIIEDIPLPDNTVDVVISNCVINLSADKRAVLKEAFRVLRPGGRFAVSDIVTTGDPPEWVKSSMEAWTGCIAGALREDVYLDLLREVGFEDAGIEVTRRFGAEDVPSEIGDSVSATVTEQDIQAVDDLYVSAFIRATKPLTA